LEVPELKRKCGSLENVVMADNKLSCDYYRDTLKNQLEVSNINVNQPWPCLVDTNTPQERSCPETKNKPTDPTNPTTKPQEEEINGSDVLFVPIWIFIVLQCVLFITELVLLILVCRA
jgi:hypothetical protein